MFAQVPFHRWGGEGIPMPVRQQLFDIGAGASCCVLCGRAGHGIHTCTKLNAPESQMLLAAWDKKWMLLLGQELTRYALCPDDAEYRRLSAALLVKSAVDHAAVLAFQREHAIKLTSPGYGGSFGRQLPKQPAVGTSAPVPQANAAPTHSKPKPKPKPKSVPKAPAKISVVGAPDAASPPVKRPRRRRNRRHRKVQQAASTQAYGLHTADMEMDAAVSAPSPVVRSPIRTGASPRMQALRTSRSTAMTPPPLLPLPSASNQLVQVSSPLLPLPTSSPQRAAGQLLPHPAPLLPSPGTAFRSIAVGSSIECNNSSSGNNSEASLRQGRSVEPSDGKNVRSISASALVPTSKSVRSSDDVCIPTSARRGEVTVGSISTAVVVRSQPSQPTAAVPSQSSQRPYQLWSLDRYLAATSSSRKLFWQRAAEDKRWEIAAALSNLPERTEAVQEARQDFGAERWGLNPGGGAGVAAELPDEDDEYL